MDQTVKCMFTCVAQVERHGPNCEVFVYNGKMSKYTPR